MQPVARHRPWLLVLALILAWSLILACPLAPAQAAQARAARGSVRPLFTPGQDITAAVVARLAKAKTSVLVQAYGFSSQPIAQALLEAHRRGVLVAIIVDKSQLSARGGQAGDLARAGVPVYVDGIGGIAHNKVMVIDQRTVLAGSFNWTAAAQARNAENLALINSRKAAQAYAANWLERLSQAQPWPSD